MLEPCSACRFRQAGELGSRFGFVLLPSVLVEWLRLSETRVLSPQRRSEEPENNLQIVERFSLASSLLKYAETKLIPAVRSRTAELFAQQGNMSTGLIIICSI